MATQDATSRPQFPDSTRPSRQERTRLLETFARQELLDLLLKYCRDGLLLSEEADPIEAILDFEEHEFAA